MRGHSAFLTGARLVGAGRDPLCSRPRRVRAAARCLVCWRTGPAGPLDGPADSLREVVCEHLTRAHPGAADDAFVVEPVRAVIWWDGIEYPHEWYHRLFPPAW